MNRGRVGIVRFGKIVSCRCADDARSENHCGHEWVETPMFLRTANTSRKATGRGRKVAYFMFSDETKDAAFDLPHFLELEM